MTEITPAEMADMIGVHAESVRRWIRAGHLPGRQVKGRYYISDIDARLFIEEYEKLFGERLSPKPLARESKYRARAKPTAPTKPQSFYVTLEAPILARLDRERSTQPTKPSRSEFVAAAVGYYLNFLYNTQRRKTG